MADLLPSPLWQKLAKFLLPRTLSQLASCSRQLSETVELCWPSASFGTDPQEWPQISRLMVGKVSRQALPLALVQAAFLLLPSTCWETFEGDSESSRLATCGTRVWEQVFRSRAFVAGSFALHMYMATELQRPPTWTPNDVDIWFPNRASVTRAAGLFTQRLQDRLGLSAQRILVKPQAAARAVEYLSLQPRLSERWQSWVLACMHQSQVADGRLPSAASEAYFQFGPGRPVSKEQLRGGRCVVSQCIDIYLDLTSPAQGPEGQSFLSALLTGLLQRYLPAASIQHLRNTWEEKPAQFFKISFIGVVPAFPGMTHWREAQRLPAIDAQAVLDRFDISVCKVGFNLRASRSNADFWHFAHKKQFEEHLANMQATQDPRACGTRRAQLRRLKYESRGFVFA